MSSENFGGNNEIEMILKDIVGEKELLIMKMMFSEINNSTSGYYKNISSRKPEENTRDMLNLECGLSMGIIEDKKCLGEVKKIFGKVEVLTFSILRISQYSLERIEESLNAIQRELRGERIYIDGRRKVVSKICIYLSGLLSEKYAMNNREVGERLGKSKEQARRYLQKRLQIKEGVFSDIFDEICEIMDRQHEELLERQDYILCIRQSINSKKYLVIDLKKEPGEEGREFIADEKEVEEILKKRRKVTKK